MKINNALWKGGIILLFSFGIFNFLNFLYQFFMVRLLSVSDFGVLATLLSLVYILAVFTESIQTLMTKYSSHENSDGKIKSLFGKALKKTSKVSLALYIIFLFISFPLSHLLGIDYFLLSISGLFIFGALLLPIPRGIMQGRKKFGSLGLNMVSEASVKLVLGVIFVAIGFSISGALAGIILAYAFAFVISFVPMRKVLKSKASKIQSLKIKSYAKPTFLITLLIIAFYSLDIVIAKIVFSAEVAGTYAIASVLSKAIFWGTQPISKAMFPLSSEDLNSKKNNKNIFSNSLTMLLILIFTALAIFFFFPDLVIFIFSGKIIFESVQILFYLGLATSIISINNLILLHKLSINKIKGYKLLFVFLGLEIILMFYFSGNLLEFSLAYVTASMAFLWGTLFLVRD